MDKYLFGRIKLKGKFILTIALVAMSATFIQWAALHWYDVKQYHETFQNSVSVFSDMIADYSTTSIQFRNSDDAREVLRSLKNESSIREAYLFDSNGQMLGEYLADGEALSVPMIDIHQYKNELVGDRLVIVRPVSLDGKIIGALYLSSDFQRLNEQIGVRLRTGALMLALLATLILALSAWCQRFIVQPIVKLSDLTVQIARERDYSSRAVKTTHDEIGVLIDGFNQMLDAIQTRDEELTTKTVHLARSNEELEQFANIAAHDLQEPLRKVRAFADRLERTYKDKLGEEGLNYLTMMGDSVKRMQTLISDLLDFARVKTRGKPFTRTDLNQVAQTIVNDLEARIAETGGSVNLDELQVIDADPVQMQQLLQNLIANALKFHKKDVPPVVTVTSQLINRAQHGPGYSILDPQICELVVSDNGIGFDEKYLDRIFNPFQKLHSRDEYEGTGIGLAICRRIAERHRGSITAKSSFGKGTSFIVTLPISQQSQHFN